MDSLEAAVAYGRTVPEAFGGAWWAGPRLQVAFTVLEPHRTALASLLSGGDVDLVRVDRSARTLGRLHAALRRRFRESPEVNTIRQGRHAVDVELRASAVRLATQLFAEHGTAVRLSLDGRPFPPTQTTFPAIASPGPRPTVERPDLRLRLTLDHPTVISGEYVRGQLEVTNRGQVPTTIETNHPLIATVLSQDGAAAGLFCGFIAGTGRLLRLDPGQSANVLMLGGTTGTLAYCTPPGNYLVVACMPLNPIDGVGQQEQIISPPVPLRVTPQQDPE